MDPRQQQAAAAIQKMAQMDPEFVKLQKIAEMKALIHEHTSRCWETCNLGDQARNSSLTGNAKNCLDLCVNNFFRAQEAVGEYMEKKLGNK